MKGRPENSFLEQFSERFMDHVRQVCTFAKLIPGFKCLHHDDQVTLLKSCVFEVLLVRLAGLFENQVRERAREREREKEREREDADDDVVRCEVDRNSGSFLGVACTCGDFGIC